jgi:isoleucyl-tRNA synthetase
MQQHQIPTYEYVDNEGKLDSSIQQPEWMGQSILKVNPIIDADLQSRGLIYKEAPVTHSVATCYRCGTRLFYAPLPAWFVNVQKLKPQLIAQNEKINWYPDYLKHGRFLKGIETAPDWNISRSRYWGTPMPVWIDPTGEHQRIIGSLAELRQWAVDPAQVDALTDIHREFLDDLAVWVDDERTVQGTRIPDVFDVWMDSASMPFASRHYPFENKAQFEASYPAQFISEYINQTRAWFYTMHVLSVGIFGQPSFLNAHTTGIILAADGTKMSKSKKNYTDPVQLIDKQGADALRLYLMSSPVAKAENLAFADSDVESIRKRVLTIWWNTFAFAQMYKPVEYVSELPNPTHIMDRWILAKLEQLRAQVTTGFEHYDVTTPARLLMDFIGELSQWYLRQSRDRLRSGTDLQAWHTFWFVLKQTAILFAPLAPMLSDVTYQHLHPDLATIHWLDWPMDSYGYQDDTLVSEMAAVRPVVEQCHGQRKALNLKVRQPLASATIITKETEPRSEILAILAQEVNIKQIIWQTQPGVETTSVTLDTQLTPELIAEGEAREIVRTLQGLRKEKNIPLNLVAMGSAPSWPADWTSYIEQKTKLHLQVKAGPPDVWLP